MAPAPAQFGPIHTADGRRASVDDWRRHRTADGRRASQTTGAAAAES